MVLAAVGNWQPAGQPSIKAKLADEPRRTTSQAYNKMFGDLVALEQRRKWLLGRATGGAMK
jgi:hypothetical protein